MKSGYFRVPPLFGYKVFQEKSVFGWQVSAKIGVRLIAKCCSKYLKPWGAGMAQW